MIIIIRWGECGDQPVLSDHPCNTELLIIDTSNGEHFMVRWILIDYDDYNDDNDNKDDQDYDKND